MWRSEDGGLTWDAKPRDLGASYDHEMLAVDRSYGRYSGRLYLSALYGRDYRLGLFRSEDDGRHWIGPVQFASGGDAGANVQKIVVFSDGEIMVTWVDFPTTPQQDSTWPGSHYWSALSKDGGVTFGPARRGVSYGRRRRGDPDARLGSDAGLAVDPSEAHRDRVFMTWTDLGSGPPRAMLAHSDDRGATWSAPRLIDGNVSAEAKQFQPRVAVNQAGTVGVSFFDTRGNSAGEWHEYFTASVDGGATFLPAVRVSSEPSRVAGGGNDRLEPMAAPGDNDVTLALISGASRWSNGGDYLGLTVDSAGVFHPLWADARTGTFQLWTAAIRVERPPVPPRARPLEAALLPNAPEVLNAACLASSRIHA